MTTYTDDMLVERYLALRARKDQIKETMIAPVDQAMEVIENEMLRRLNERGAKNTKTEHGTAYVSTTLSLKTEDREALIGFVRETQSFDLLTAAVSKEAVKELMETNGGHPPPGVTATFVAKVNFRKS